MNLREYMCVLHNYRTYEDIHNYFQMYGAFIKLNHPMSFKASAKKCRVILFKKHN